MKIKFSVNKTPFLIDINDKNQYDLYQIGVNTKESSKNFGKTIESHLGYFTKMDHMLEKVLMATGANSTEEFTIKGYIEALNNWKEEVKQLIEKVK